MKSIKEGDIVRVVESGENFSSYREWLAKDLQGSYQHGVSIEQGVEGVVVQRGPHSANRPHGACRYGDLLGVRVNGRVFIITVKGVELVRSSRLITDPLIQRALTLMLEKLDEEQEREQSLMDTRLAEIADLREMLGEAE